MCDMYVRKYEIYVRCTWDVRNKYVGCTACIVRDMYIIIRGMYVGCTACIVREMYVICT